MLNTELTTNILSCFLFVAGIFILIQAPMLAAVMKSKVVARRRIYRLGYAAGQLKREFKSTVLNITLESLLIAAAFNSGIARMDESHVAGTFLASFVWLEIWFYFMHRAMHSKLLWPIHRAHHESKVCSPLTAMTFSLTESVIMVGGLLAGVTLISQVYPVSFLGFAAYFAFLQTLVLFGHSNIEVVPPFIARIVFFWSSPTHHALHHSRIKGHYGLMTTFLDRWFGTEFEDYRRVQQAAFAKSGLVSIGQRLPLMDTAAVPALSAAMIEELRSERLALNATWAGSSPSQPLKVHQAPLVAKWLAQEITGFPSDVSLDLLLRFDAQQCAWYLMRQNEIFGPMSLNDLSELKQSGSLRNGDECFSLKMQLRTSAENLPAQLAAPAPAAARELFLNRRQPRTRLQSMVSMKSPVNVVKAMTMDVSTSSAAVYVKSRLKEGDRYQIEISNAGEGPFRTDVVIANIQPFGDGFRCGLLFVNLERRATAKWGSLIKKSRAAAA